MPSIASTNFFVENMKELQGSVAPALFPGMCHKLLSVGICNALIQAHTAQAAAEDANFS